MKTAVVSCPECYRQYNVEPTVKVGMCSGCKSQFAIVFARLSEGGEEPVLLEPALVGTNSFYRGACVELGTKVTKLFKMAGVPVSKAAVLEVVESLPRSRADLKEEAWQRGRFYSLLERAYARLGDRDEGFKELTHYFICYLPSLSERAIDSLCDAFRGVLSVELEQPVTAPPARKGLFDRLVRDPR